MSIKLIRQEVLRFIEDSDKGVLVMSGHWGVGKTFAWNAYLKEAQGRRTIGLPYYAYVSLFGLGGLDALKSALFQNTVGSEAATTPANMATLSEAIGRAPTNWRRSFGIMGLLPTVGKLAESFAQFGFMSVDRQLVCIDDLERKSDKIKVSDVLGLASFLSEQRNCKVVLLLNDEKFSDPNEKEEYDKNIEKIADVSLRFEPTPQEAVDLGANHVSGFFPVLSKNVTTLGIVNIRTIKKIEVAAARLAELLSEFDPRVLEQAVHTLCLLMFSKLQPSDAPTLEFLRKTTDFSIAFEQVFEEIADGPKPDAKEEGWAALLANYGFREMDRFDGAILRFVETGCLPEIDLRDAAQTLETEIRANDANESYKQAWALYYNTFDDNREEVCAAQVDAVLTNAGAISPTGLSSTVTLLKDLEWNGDISGLITSYVESRNEAASFWDLEDDTFGGDVADKDVRSAFAAKFQSFAADRDPAEILWEMAKNQGWSRRDLAMLSGLSEDDFYGLYRAHDGDELKGIIRGSLSFRPVVNADDQMREITDRAVAALRRVGSENLINKRRVRQRGIDVPD